MLLVIYLTIVSYIAHVVLVDNLRQIHSYEFHDAKSTASKPVRHQEMSQITTITSKTTNVHGEEMIVTTGHWVRDMAMGQALIQKWLGDAR